MRKAAIALVLAVAFVGVAAAAPTVAAGPGSGTVCHVGTEPGMEVTTPVGVDASVPMLDIECYY